MNLTGKETQTSQVVTKLEKAIISGKYAPGSRLPGSRELCDDLGVTRIIVRSAIDILEKKRLVVKKARKGVYINSNILSLDKIELYAMSYQNSSSHRTYSYLENTLCLYNDLRYRSHFNLTLRGLGRDKMNLDMFKNELSKVKSIHAQVLVLCSPFLDSQKIELLQKSGIPFLVIGELFHPVKNNEFNQVYESCVAKAEPIGDFMIKQPYCDIVRFAYPQGMMDFESEYSKALEEKVRNAGKQITTVHMNVSPTRKRPFDEVVAQTLYEVLESGKRPDLLHIDEAVNVSQIKDILAEFNLSVPEDINLLVNPSLDQLDDSPGVMKVQVDYRDFAAAVFDRLDEICRNPEEFKKMDITHLRRLNITGSELI